MNRTIALFLALAVLLAHALALHESTSGDVAPPYDQAHVAYRLGRNLAQTGAIAWEADEAGAETHPSLLLIGLASIAERAYVSVTIFCQSLGAIATFLVVIAVSFFSPVRLAGVIAPLLLVVSGGLASSALSGTEVPLAALFAITGFLAFERRRPVLLAISLPLLCATRAEGVLLAIAIFLCELSGPRLARPAGRRMLAAFVPAGLLLVAVSTIRYFSQGTPLSPAMSKILACDGFARGSAFVIDFAVGSVTPFLIAFPLWYFMRRTLPATGGRALLFSGVWSMAIAASGGGSMPFAGEMIPVLPILCVSVQEAMTLALDSQRRGLPQLSWALFLFGMIGSGLASKFPGDLGPIPTERLHRNWLKPRASMPFGYDNGLSRLALFEELQVTERLRAIGLFLRDHVDPDSTLLTPWPGSVGYLSSLRVIDLMGRVSVAPPRDRVVAWSGRPRADVLAALELAPDYIMPSLKAFHRSPPVSDLAADWIEGLDLPSDNPEQRHQQLVSAFAHYEMLAVPIQYEAEPPSADAAVLHLLRRRNLKLAPQLTVDVKEGIFTVEARHRSHGQIVDLRVQVVDNKGSTWSMRPTGEFVQKPNVLARTRLFLPDTGNRSIRLVMAALPTECRAVRMRIALRNPGARGDHLFADASEVVAVDLR